MSISLLQAKTLALASVSVAPVKRVTLKDALGRFLAEGVTTKQPSPLSDCSAVDGYALASTDTQAARKEHPVLVRLVGEVHSDAALPDRDLKPGEAMRVRAGAPVPFGADAVASSEHASDDGQRASVSTAVAAGQNVRRRGEEWPQGELLLHAGHRVDAASLGVMLSLGIEDVPVRPWTRVAVFAPGEGTPTDALLVMLASRLQSAATEVVAVERCAEREEVVAGMLDRFLSRADVLVVCPGVAPASRELLKGVIKRVGGTWGFDGVAMKPGRHAAIAVLKGKPVAVLPAPALAALVGFEQLLWPMLLKRHGVVERRRRLNVRLDAPIRKRPGRAMFVPAKLDVRGGELFATFRAPASTYLVGALGIDGWLVLPAEHGEYKAGDSAEVELSAGATYSGLATNPSDEATR
jgi:molybdopterin molybdotransferase